MNLRRENREGLLEKTDVTVFIKKKLEGCMEEREVMTIRK